MSGEIFASDHVPVLLGAQGPVRVPCLAARPSPILHPNVPRCGVFFARVLPRRPGGDRGQRRGGVEEGVVEADEWEYDCLVRVKTSITLPKDLLVRLDRVDKNRSSLIERAAVAYLARLAEEERDRKDIEIINRSAARLNREAMDTLGYQQLP